jgi:hypothetical protein
MRAVRFEMCVCMRAPLSNPHTDAQVVARRAPWNPIARAAPN